MLSQPMQRQVPCNIQIDYSNISTGNKTLPFIIQLDLENSILNPAPGENQRFCYIVTGSGEGGGSEADLSHWVLGICNQIIASQIVNISVFIDDVEQTVVFGEDGNVQLRTPDKPDPPTGCAGLKFDFGLNKVNGVMNVCFELTTPYAVGPNSVCLFGGNSIATGLTICGPICEEPPDTCPSTAYQSANVCVPVTVTPFARLLPAITHCCGDPVITSTSTRCPGTLNGSCTLTIQQRLCIEVPIEFGARATSNAMYVTCTGASENFCPNCTANSEVAQAYNGDKTTENAKNISEINHNIKNRKSFFF